MTNDASPRRSLKPALTLAFLLPLLLLSVYVHFRTAGGAGAKNWLMLAERMMFMGRKLYVDIIEVNPPLILWIYALPEWVAQHVPLLNDAQVLVLMGFMTVALCVAVCERLLRLHPGFRAEPRRRFWFGLLMVFVFVFYTTPVYFFDRDHILLMMVFPYVLRFMPSLARTPLDRRFSLLIGGMAAVGFCMKPHTAVVFATLQLLYIRRERSAAILKSAENLIIYAGAAIYGFCVWHFAREYLTVVLPMALPTYSLYRAHRIDNLKFIVPVLLILALTFVDFRRNTSPFRRDIPYFLGACFAFFLYAMVNNGWGYTFNPLISCTLILCGWVWMEYLYLKEERARQGQPVKQFTFGARSCAVTFGFGASYFLLCFFSYFFTFDCESDDMCRQSRALLEETRKYPRHSFSTFATGIDQWLPMLHATHTELGSRFGDLWMLPRFMLHDEAFNKREHWILEYVSKGYGEDFDRWKPDTMFVDTSPELYRNFPNTDLIAFLSFTPEFREAWKHYRLVATIDVCHMPASGNIPAKDVKVACRYQVYQRKD